MFSFKQKTSLEAEVLRYVGQPYIIFSQKGDFMRGHPKVSEMLWNLGLGENQMQTRDALIAGLKSQEMNPYDDAARQILNEQLLLENTTDFSCVSEYEGFYVLVQVKDTDAGSYALFKDITHDYILLSSGMRLAFDSFTMLGGLKNIPCGVLICDARDEGNPILCANNQFLKTASITGKDVQDRPVVEILSRYFYHRDLHGLLHDYLENGTAFSIDIERQDQGFFQWIRLGAQTVESEDGALNYFIISVEDLTDVKTRQAQQNQSYKMEILGQLASGVAHDFNNVLSVVEGYARMIRKDYDSEDLVEKVDYIIDSVQKGSALTKQVMNYGRQVRMKPEVIDLGQTILNLKPLLKPLLNETIVLSIDVIDDVFIRCAPDNMVRVLMNLVVNGRDAMEGEGGKITVSLFPDKKDLDYVVLSVKDEGCGMSEEVQKRIFDPYYTTKSNDKGTGVGMSTVQSLVKKMNAGIDINSQEGLGTEMLIRIPRSLEKPKENTEDSASIAGDTPLSGLTIMLVEDNADLLDVLAKCLEGYGAKVLATGNANKALEIQDEHEGEIELLLTDVVMPDLSGIRLSELFESVRPNIDTIFFSGYSPSSQVVENQVPANVPFIPKPIDHEVLLKTILEKRSLLFLDVTRQEKKVGAKKSAIKSSYKALYTIAGNALDRKQS